MAKKNSNNKKKIIKAAALLLSVILFTLALLPVCTAAGGKTTVRVGWYESPFNQTDEFERRSGYAYEYQQKIAAYTGWSYEYVTGSWSDLLQMLIDGKIDLMSDVSYTEEREKIMHFSSLPMGEEEYYIYVAPNNEEISSDTLSTLNGKKIGINKGSVMIGLFETWAEANGVKAEITELTDTASEALEKLRNGAIDAYVSLNGYFDLDEAVPLSKIGATDFYFAVSTARPELVDVLNAAMNRIQNENPYYNHQLTLKYIQRAGVNLFLTADEKSWVSSHGKIRVGYQDNYLAFCASDPVTGELTGALKEYLEVASGCLENAQLEFETIAYPTASAAMEALKNGEVDCMFPANLTDYDGEVQGYFMTSPIMRTDISAIILESEKKTFASKEHVTVAVNAGNPNYNMFLIDNFPEWRSVIFKDTPECLKAISDGRADCLLMSNYRYNNISALCKKYGLISVSTGVEMDYCFAVRRDSTVLYSVLNKVADIVPDSTINAALSFYFTEDAKVSFGEMIVQNIGIVLTVFAVIVAGLVILLIYNVRSRKKAVASQNLITATEHDPLTGLYNKNYFYAYAAQLYRENPSVPMDAIVLNIENFHSVNAIHGWEFGDNVIRALGDGITAFVNVQGGIAGHAEADRFAIYCPHLDNYNDLFERLQKKINQFSSNNAIWLRMGVMPWESGSEPRQLIEHALVACSLARGRYKEHMVIFDGHVREREAYEQRLKNDLGRAITACEFEVHYQPKYDITVDPPVFRSAEALVRWRHHELGLIPPGDFIPLFEQNGQVSEIDRFVWEEVASQIARWKDKYGVTVHVSVNLSRVDIYDPLLESRLDELLEKNGLDRGALSLEVTESAYTENSDEVINVIERLRKNGYEIEMDDFGTGYSSLNLLSSLPVNALKMDREFIKNIGRNEKDDHMIEVILDIAKEINVPVIAEGVETEEQLKLLKKLGCELVQGFYFSRPLPPHEFETAYLKIN